MEQAERLEKAQDEVLDILARAGDWIVIERLSTYVHRPHAGAGEVLHVGLPGREQLYPAGREVFQHCMALGELRLVEIVERRTSLRGELRDERIARISEEGRKAVATRDSGGPRKGGRDG